MMARRQTPPRPTNIIANKKYRHQNHAMNLLVSITVTLITITVIFPILRTEAFSPYTTHNNVVNTHQSSASFSRPVPVPQAHAKLSYSHSGCGRNAGGDVGSTRLSSTST